MSGATGISAVALYPQLARNEPADVARFEASDPSTKMAIAYFRKQAPKLATPAALLKDYRSLQVVLGAFGMSKDIGSTALLRQLMTQDPTDKASVAARIANPLYTRFAKFMSQWTPPPLSSASAVATIVGQFATNGFEQAEGAQSPGLQEALYFRRMAGSVTSVPQLIGDATLMKVAASATGLTFPQLGVMDYAQQVSVLSKAVDVAKFKTPAYVDQFVQRYLAQNQAAGGSAPDPTGALAILGVSSGEAAAPNPLSALYPQAGAGGTAALFAGGIGALFSTSA